jgi:ribosome maturation factor RimP
MQALIEATVAGLGYDLIEVELTGRGLLRVTIDQPAAKAAKGETIHVDDCEKVTRQLQYALEVEGTNYSRLEVGSPGVDRLLKRPEDFVRFAGEEIVVVLNELHENRKRFSGTLQAPQASDKPGEYALVYPANAAAKLVAKARLDGKPLSKTAQKKADAEAKFAELKFALHEAAEVRLDPVLNFKGSAKDWPAGAEQVEE